jgi:hypothetical protein
VTVTWIRAVVTVTSEIIGPMIEATDRIVGAAAVPWSGVIEHSLKTVTGILTDALTVAASENENMKHIVPGDEADFLVHLFVEVRATVAREAVLGLALESGPEGVLDPVLGPSDGVRVLGVALLLPLWTSTAMCHPRATEASHLGAGFEPQRENESEISDHEWVILTVTCRPLNETMMRLP